MKLISRLRQDVYLAMAMLFNRLSLPRRVAGDSALGCVDARLPKQSCSCCCDGGGPRWARFLRTAMHRPSCSTCLPHLSIQPVVTQLKQGALGCINALLAEQARCRGRVGGRPRWARFGAQGLAQRMHLVQIALHNWEALSILRQ